MNLLTVVLMKFFKADNFVDYDHNYTKMEEEILTNFKNILQKMKAHKLNLNLFL